MQKEQMASRLAEVRNRLDYAERNINSHILESSDIAGKVPVDGIVISILKDSRDTLASAYREYGLDPAALIESFDNAIENCDRKEYTYIDRKELIAKLKRYTYAV